MKCIEHGGTVKRVEDQEADTLVSAGKAHYVAKKTWKMVDTKGHKQRQAECKYLESKAAAKKKVKEEAGT